MFDAPTETKEPGEWSRTDPGEQRAPPLRASPGQPRPIASGQTEDAWNADRLDLSEDVRPAEAARSAKDASREVEARAACLSSAGHPGAD